MSYLQAALVLYGADHATHLNRALQTRDVIGQAKGILAERFTVSDDEAFQMLDTADTTLSWASSGWRSSPVAATGYRIEVGNPSCRRGQRARAADRVGAEQGAASRRYAAAARDQVAVGELSGDGFAAAGVCDLDPVAAGVLLAIAEHASPEHASPEHASPEHTSPEHTVHGSDLSPARPGPGSVAGG